MPAPRIVNAPPRELDGGEESFRVLRPNMKKLAEYTGRENDCPISWTKPYGKGRVFYCSLGVQNAPYSSPQFFRYLLDGIQFAIGDLPADTTPSEK